MRNPKVYDDIITGIEPVVEKVIKFNKDAYLNDAANAGRPWTQNDEEYIRLLTTYKLVDAVTKYVLPEDELKHLKAKTSAGQITADILINRDGDKKVEIRTEVILAGGYNIQRIHNRYITKVYGDKKRNTTPIEAVKALNTKVKTFNKIENLEQEIKGYKNNIIKFNERIKNDVVKTEDQIIADSERGRFLYENLADINPGSYNATILKTEDDVKVFNDNLKKDIIETYHKENNWKKTAVKDWEKAIAKVQAKIEKIKNQ